MRNFIGLVLTIINFCLPGQNFIATYEFSNVTTSSGHFDPGPAPIVENLVMGNFHASNSGANPGASGRFSFSNWPVGAQDGVDDYETFTASLPPFTYYEVGISIAPNHTLELKGLSFYVRRSGTGIRNYCVRTSLDNYANNIAASTGTNNKLQVLEGDVFFWKYDSISTSSDQRGSSLILDKEYRELTDTIAFRFYAWNAEASGGTFSIDNVTVSGYVKDSAFFAGLSTKEMLQGVRFYPNPVAGEILSITSEIEIDKLTIEDLTGRSLIQEQPHKKHMEIKTNGLPSGIYVITISSGPSSINKKLIVPLR